jgi:riboflavin-specific deaminase-like protein
VRTERSVHRPTPALSDDDAWALLRALARVASRREGIAQHAAVALQRGELVRVPQNQAWIVISPDRDRGWEPRRPVSYSAAELLDLYLPLCVGPLCSEIRVAHLGQSLDGRVATPRGASPLITGPEDMRHTHRMRALFDAVVVGATTVEVDDPRLTTRLVPGDRPVRVILDPTGRVSHDRRVVRENDARTMLVVGREHAIRHLHLPDHVEVVPAAIIGGRFDLADVLGELRGRGLRRIFVEGGGVTVSRLIDARLLHRLQIAVASRIIGFGGPAIQLQGAANPFAGHLIENRRFLLGPDILFDCRLDFGATGSVPAS